MAFTKINAAGIGTTETVTVDGLTVINDGSFGGNLTVSGVLTYEDVTNVDSVGLITARNGIVVGSGITLSKDGDIFATGITTVSGNVKVGTGITLSPDGDGFFTGVITATSYSGIDLSDVTGATGDFSIADKIVHTGDTNTAIRFPSADTIQFETAGSARLQINDNGKILIATTTTSEAHANQDELIIGSSSDDANHGLTIVTPNDHYGTVAFSDGSGGTSQGLLEYNHSGDYMRIYTAASERLRIDSAGRLSLGVSASPGSYPIGATARQVQAEIKGAIDTSNNKHDGSLALNCTNNNANLHLIRSDNNQSADVGLSNISFSGFDGTDYHVGAQISAIRDAAGGNNDIPTRLVFLTTADGASTPTERLRISATGQVLIGAGAIATPKASTSGLDVSSALLSIVMGGSSGSNYTARANSTQKEARLVIPHYTNAEEPMVAIAAFASSASNQLNLGGGTSLGNVATEINFHIASNTTTTGNSQAWQIASDGDLIGTSPAVIHSGSSAGSLTLYGGATNHGGKIALYGGSTTSDIRFYAESGTSSPREVAKFNQYGFLKLRGDATSYLSDANDYHEMQADNANVVTLRMRHGSTNGYGIITEFNHGKSTHYAFRVYNFSSGSTNMFIRTDGDLENINNSYGSTSDIKLKENIVDANSQWDDIKALKVRNFNYKADENKTKLLGLVAQEAETVCPSLVKTQPDLGSNNEDLGTETKYLKYSILYMKAIKALQEAQTRIETLESKVAALEG